MKICKEETTISQMQHIFNGNIFFYKPWLRISLVCRLVNVLNDTQIYKLWAFSMSNINLENRTVKKAEMLSEKYNTGIIIEYATSIKDLSLLKLPSGETT